MPSISVTCDVFQFPMSWLKSAASVNIQAIFFTPDVSQLEMSPLNVFAYAKPWYESVSKLYPLISVTKLVSQFGIVP